MSKEFNGGGGCEKFGDCGGGGNLSNSSTSSGKILLLYSGISSISSPSSSPI